MSHYETLGVQKNASKDEIRKAYRRKSAKAHPDKGGSDAEMAEINRAYETLSDEQRRLTYDRSGEDANPNSPEHRAKMRLMDVFAAIVVEQGVTDLVDLARRMMQRKRDEIMVNISKAQSHKDLLTKQRKRVKTKRGAQNLFHMVIDSHLALLEQAIAKTQSEADDINAALKLLSQYEADAIQVMIGGTIWTAAGA